MSEKLIGFLKGVPAKAWVYAAVIVAAFLAIALPLGLTGAESAWYSVFWGAFGACAALVVARTIYHCASGDNSAEMWAISIYGLAADLGWLIGIMSTTYAVATIGIVITVAGALMAFGTRFIGRGGVKVQEADLLRKLCGAVRYRFMGDVVEGVLDIRRPLVVIESIKDPLTVDEARSAGFAAEADEAVAYLKGAIANSRVAKEKK